MVLMCDLNPHQGPSGQLLLLLGWPGVVAVASGKGNPGAFLHKLFVPSDPPAPCAELIPRHAAPEFPAVTQRDGSRVCARQGLMLSSASAAPSLSGSCDGQGFPPVLLQGVGFGSCRGWFASLMDLWGVTLENSVYLWKCSSLGHSSVEENTQPVALGISFPS